MQGEVAIYLNLLILFHYSKKQLRGSHTFQALRPWWFGKGGSSVTLFQAVPTQARPELPTIGPVLQFK